MVNSYCTVYRSKWLIHIVQSIVMPIVWSTAERRPQRLSCQQFICESQISARESLGPAKYSPHVRFFKKILKTF